jgi:hypothetical protein
MQAQVPSQHPHLNHQQGALPADFPIFRSLQIGHLHLQSLTNIAIDGLFQILIPQLQHQLMTLCDHIFHV